MTDIAEKRSRNAKTAGTSVQSAGVGARRMKSPLPTQGGGYPNICIKNRTAGSEKIARDPRIDELRRAGLSWRLVAIADAVGYETFVELWQMLSLLYESSDLERTSCVRIVIPHIRKLEKIQRNNYIYALHEQGLNAREIRELLRRKTGITISCRQICRLINRRLRMMEA